MPERSTMRRFEGTVAVVTGGGKGIGKACCLRFAEEGARVAVLDLSSQDARDTAASCEALDGNPALALHCDVTDKGSVAAAFAAIANAWGRIDALVASAGIYSSQPLPDVPLREWQRVIDVNLTGVFLCNQAVAPIMMAQRSGAIINISSMAGKTSWEASAQYSAAKTGVIGLTRSVAMELAPFGCTANTICPGNTETDLIRSVAVVAAGRAHIDSDAWLAMRRHDCPMGRLARPEEIAGVAAFLASCDAGYITGQAIEVDGGMVLS